MKSLLRTVTLALAGLTLAAPLAHAQTGATVTGRVTNETGAPIASAAVSIPSTTLGTVTDDNGRYTLIIPPSRANTRTITLTARRIGYALKTVTVTLSHDGPITQDFSLAPLPLHLQEMVVTALGVQQEKSQLGTAQQEVSTEELNTTRAQNFVEQLDGKVSGLVITGPGTPGGSTKITIRGSNSINGNNNPLFVVDGIPVSNDDRGANTHEGGLAIPSTGAVSSASTGIDLGSVINDLNPDDIEAISVLKGPNAAALYGSRAANGVILITTKHGQASAGQVHTELTSTYTWERPSTYMDWQNLYGQGSAGEFQYVDGKGGGINDGYDQSYGPRLDGRPIDQFQGKQQPWVAHPDNVSSFFNTGHNFSNTLAVSGGTDNASARLSVGNTTVNGVIPNNTFQNFNALLSGTLRLTSRFNATASVEYFRNQARNRPGVGYNTSILEQFIWFGRQVDMNLLRQKQFDANGNLYNWNLNFHNNPYWLVQDNPESDRRDRVIASASGTYQLADWLSATLRGGQDYYNWDINRDYAAGHIIYSDPNYAGAFSVGNQYNSEYNTDLLLNAITSLTPSLKLNGLVGGTIRRNDFHSSNTYTAGISVPGIYNVSNAAITPTLNQFQSQRQVNSVYGSASFTWNDWWTVEGTARNDWSSTLPVQHNSYFYPSVNTSVVLTDAVPALRSRLLSYAKLRASYARVGNDADPYQLATVYVGNSNKFGSLPQYSLSDNLANANLKPELTTSGEGGTELAFLDSRITLDASYYDKRTRNQVLNLVIPPTSGFGTQSINAGSIRNHGVELSLAATPLRSSRGLQWTSTVNWARNQSMVESLSPGLTTVVLGGDWSLNVEARVGQPYGALVGYTFLRDSAGNLLTENGMPIRGSTRRVLGNVNPDWTGGWSNDFQYGPVGLHVLLDVRHGGQIFSITNMMCEQSGTCASTLRGRQVDWNNPGILVNGIDRTTGKPNTTRVTSEQYFQSLWLIHSAYIYDDSYVKLREVRVGYDLPQRLASRLNARRVNLSLVGRNLWTHSNVPNIDPEFSLSTGNSQGLEFAQLANNRVFGLTVQITP